MKSMKFFSGHYVTIDEIENYIKQSKKDNRVILIAGSHCSGKTTLITSIYEYFQRNLYKYPFIFSGSKTLIELERLCYFSRISSNGNNQQERTTLDEKENFIHLCVRDKLRKMPSVNLYLSDFPGEKYLALNSNNSEFTKLKSLTIVDHIVFLVDGKELVSNRSSAYDTTISIIKSVLDFINSNKLSPNITLLFSKWDIIRTLETEKRKSVVKYIKNRNDKLRAFINHQYGIDLFITEIAARPSRDSLVIDKNIVGLLSQWIYAK